MALLKGEGTHQILYGGVDLFTGLRHNRGYLARPDHAGSFDTVLLVHGAGGMTSSVKSVARRLARQGLAVVGPDLLRGAGVARQAPPPWPDAGRMVSDLADAIQWLASADTPWVRSGPVGVVAIGKGASPAVRLVDSFEHIGALVLISPVFAEGSPSTPVPLLGFYGKQDETVGPEARLALQQDLNHGEWILYGEVGHGLVDESSVDYRWDVAEDVIERTVAFLGRTLGG